MNRNTKLFIHENALEYIICEMAAILSRGRWVKQRMFWGGWQPIVFFVLMGLVSSHEDSSMWLCHCPQCDSWSGGASLIAAAPPCSLSVIISQPPPPCQGSGKNGTLNRLPGITSQKLKEYNKICHLWYYLMHLTLKFLTNYIRK